MTGVVRVDAAADLDVAAMLQVVDGARVVLGKALVDGLRANRDAALARLTSGRPVYGVTTGMGAASEVRLDEFARSRHQDHLMVGRSVGSAPWLDAREARAAVVFRLRDFLSPEAAVSPELCVRLVEMLDRGLTPAIPATGLGAAGEIISLAHLGGLVTGLGDALVDGDAVPAADALTAAGLAPYALGPKEGVAMIEGVPVTTARAALIARSARAVLHQGTASLAASLVVAGANLDPFDPRVARADPDLDAVLGAVRALVGARPPARGLQAPLSFRVAAPALAHLARAIDAVDAAVVRAVDGVTDSPAFLDGDFVGTAGFDGFDLAAGLDGLRLALTRVAETSASRLHRLLDDRVTGLPRQLSARPGLDAGMVTVHKRAVGVVHAMLRASGPASLGAIETSLGQEDVQSFSLEAAEACREAVRATTEVMACELLAIVQATRLVGDGRLAGMSGALTSLLDGVTAAVPPGTDDRPFGRDVSAVVGLLDGGWASSGDRPRG